jgi:hypothetical protein
VKIDTYIVKLPRRTGKATISEHPEHIMVVLTFSRYGDLGDEAEIRLWLGEVLKKYEYDPRPVCMPNPTTNELAIVT